MGHPNEARQADQAALSLLWVPLVLSVWTYRGVKKLLKPAPPPDAAPLGGQPDSGLEEDHH